MKCGNYSVVGSSPTGKLISRREPTQPVIEALARPGHCGRRSARAGHMVDAKTEDLSRNNKGGPRTNSEGKTKPGEGAKSTWSKDMVKEMVKRKLSLADAKNRSKWANKSEISPTTTVEQEGGSEEENINVTTTNLTIQQISRLQGRRRSCVGKS